MLTIPRDIDFSDQPAVLGALIDAAEFLRRQRLKTHILCGDEYRQDVTVGTKGRRDAGRRMTMDGKSFAARHP